MQAEARCVHSVSDLYAADEVELLLEELRDLERPAPDVQDFEIAGSQTGGGGWTPEGTVHSWDSHPHYRRTPPPPPARVAPLYCHVGQLLTPGGALRLFVAICSLCCVWLEYAAGGAGLWLLPSAGRLRLLLATALFSLLASGALLFLDISRLVILFPFNWAKLNAWLYICVGVMYVIAGSMALAAVVSDDYWWVPAATTDRLVAAASFGLLGGLGSLAAAVVYCYGRPRLGGASPSPTGSPGHAYLPVPTGPEPTPGSSRGPL